MGAHATPWRKELLKCDCYDILHKHAEIEIERERDGETVLINWTARFPEAMER